MQDCGSCGPEWKILSVKQASGSNYAVQFDALRVTSFTWSVVKDCQTFKAGTVSPTSSEVTLDFSGINTDGVYWLKAETTACRGFCFPFEFRITHNGGVVEEPLSTPELSVTGVDSDTIRLDWTHGGGADDFTVQSSIDGETWTDYATYSGTLRTADTSPWTPDTLYWFRIRARKGSSYSDWSNEASGVATDNTTNPRARKVLLHNAVQWDFINLSVNDAKVAKVVSGGVTHVTILLNWWDIETAQDVYDFTKLDAAIDYFHSKGLKSLLQLPFRFAYAGMPNASDKAYIDTSASILLRSGNRAILNVEGAIGSKTNPFYVERQLKIIARICDHIATTDLKTKCQHALFIDGGSNETGFYTGTTGGIDDGDFSPSTNNDFVAFLQKKYVTVSALNSAWGSNYSVFRQIQVGDYKPTKYSSYYIGYNDNQRTRDWWEYMCVSHKLFYRQVLKAAHNPQSIDPTLSSTNTGIEVAAYLTEGLTGQGVFWGSGVINMLSEFDIIFSSRGAMDGSHVDGNHLKSFAHMMSALRGCLPSKAFGQEMDGDVLFANGQRIGPSRLARTTFAQGAEWLIYVFYDEIAEWDEDVYYSINGDTLTFLQDSQLAVSTYVTGQNRTLPTPSSSLNFGLFDVLSTPNNPNNTVSSWVASVSPDGEGLSSTYVDITMTEILLSNY